MFARGLNLGIGCIDRAGQRFNTRLCAFQLLLTFEQTETLSVDGQSTNTVKWVCQPRNRFDAKVEFWVSAQHDWLPVRIRITQVSGSFIDLNLRGTDKLPALPPTEKATPP